MAKELSKEARLVASEDFSAQDYKLLEISSDLLPAIEANRVFIKGRPEDEAVLCTEDKTFVIRLVELSSTNLLLPPTSSERPQGDLNGPVVRPVVGGASGYFELVEIAPRLRPLKVMLFERPYSGSEDEDETLPNSMNVDEGMGAPEPARRKKKKGQIYTWKDLHSYVQASDNQLRKALLDLTAFEHKGYWRVLDPDVSKKIIDYVINLIDETRWSLEGVSVSECIEAFKEENFDEVAVRQTLRTYSTEESRDMEGDCQVFTLDPRKLLIFRAVQLFTDVTPRYRMEDFIEAWEQCAPVCCAPLKPDLSMLKGMYLTEQLANDLYIKYFPLDALPVQPADRLKRLFDEVPRWTLADLEPYIRDLIGPKDTLESILLKYTRCIPGSTKSSPAVYCARDL